MQKGAWAKWKKMPPAPKWGNFPLGEHCRFFLHLLFFGIPNFGSGDPVSASVSASASCSGVLLLVSRVSFLAPLSSPLCRSLAPIHPSEIMVSRPLMDRFIDPAAALSSSTNLQTTEWLTD